MDKKGKPAYFAGESAIVRTIWGRSDTVLFIFAASAAEFALSKSVDWLYYTGKLPADPLGRLFSTVGYARQIIFSEKGGAEQAIGRINHIHAAVEKSRGSHIPGEAYRDVLYMLADYSIRAFELLDRKLTTREKAEIYQVFKSLGESMLIGGLPEDYPQWRSAREKAIRQRYEYSAFTADLFLQYKKHLGPLRFFLLKQVQAMMLPGGIARHIRLKRSRAVNLLFLAYKTTRNLVTGQTALRLMIPARYRAQVVGLNISSQG